jgi:hypothetical protein
VVEFSGLGIRKANGSKSRKDAELLNYSDLISLKQSNQSGNIGPSPRAGRRLKQHKQTPARERSLRI